MAVERGRDDVDRRAPALEMGQRRPRKESAPVEIAFRITARY